jgi:D-xylose transport system permease protein
MPVDTRSSSQALPLRPRPQDLRRRILNSARPGNAGIVYALAILVIVFSLSSAAEGGSNYLSGINIGNVLDQSTSAGILVPFMTIVLISGRFDLSVGSVGGFAAVVSLEVVDQRGIWLAAALAIGSGIGFGLLNGIIVEYLKVNPFVVTLGSMTAIAGLTLVVTDGNSVIATQPSAIAQMNALSSAFLTANLTLILGIITLAYAIVLAFRKIKEDRVRSWLPAIIFTAAGLGLLVIAFTVPLTVRWTRPVWYMLALTFLVWAVLHFTVVGRRLYAVGGNPEAARLSGIAVRRYRLVAFTLSGAAAGFVGLLFAARLSAANPDALSGLELTVIAAAILGGTSLFGGSGSVLLSLVGAIFLYAIADGFNILNLGSNYQDLIQGVILIAAAATYTAKTRARKAIPDAAHVSTPDSFGAVATADVGDHSPGPGRSNSSNAL